MSDTPKTALITGAAQRVGRAIALDLAAHGWALAIHCNRSRAEADKVAAEITRNGGRARVVTGNLRHEAEVEKIMPAATAALGPVTALVNNASLFEDDTVETATRESWDNHMEVNLRAPFVLSQAFLRQLPEGVPGNIINIIDQRVWRLTPKFTSYTLSKAGLWTLTRTMAQALAPQVRVNAIGPGPVLPSTRQAVESFNEQVAAVPLARQTQLQEISAAIRFILETPAMTGQMIALDGGQHLSWRTPDVLVQE